VQGWWGDFVAGKCSVLGAALLAFFSLVVSLALLAFVFRPLVDAISRKDSERVRAARVRRISFSLLVASFALTLFVFLHGILSAETRHDRLLFELVELFLIIFTLYAVSEVAVSFFADFLPQLRGNPPVTPIYKDIFRTIVLFGAFLFALKQAFPKAEIGTLLTTSAILSVVLGLALQDSLSNIFAGITISVDRPFKPGDWLLADGQEGKVLDSNWRSTRLINRDNNVWHVPNMLIAKSKFLNYSQPTGLHLCRRNVGVAHSAPPNKVRSILVEMMRHVEGVLKNPLPEVFTLEYGELAATYELRFWIQDFDARTRIESDVMRGAWYHLHRNRIRIASPTRDVYVRREQADRGSEEVLDLLRRVDILNPLGAEEFELFAEDLVHQLFAQGEMICRQGDSGSTFYLVKSGLVSVQATGRDGSSVEVARLKPGDHFGEMSLLTGESRNSTCVALEDVELLCLDRESFAVLLSENPAVAKSMSEILAARTLATQQKLAEQEGTLTQMRGQSVAVETRRILDKIWSIFGFRR